MNIIIVGCGNVGFETAKLLSKEHNLLLIDIQQHPYITDFLKDKENVTFAQADATNMTQVENAIKAFTDRHPGIDALISTTGALVEKLPTDNFPGFRKNFELNFFGNLVPIKCVIDSMIAAKSGRLIVMSSTVGHLATRSLTAYSSAKWALESFSSALRSELRPFGITVDVICPASIKNRYSKVFIDTYNTIEPSRVASKIERLLQRPANANHFIPARYRSYHLAERMTPYLLDRLQGVKPKMERERRLKNVPVDNVMIVGASSAIGKKLAYRYAKSAKRLYLVDRDAGALLQLKNGIGAIPGCEVNIAAPDLRDTRSIKDYADGIDRIDLFVNIPGPSEIGAVCDIPLDLYRENFDAQFFGVLYLLVELLKRENKPKKIVSVLSPVVIAGRRYHSSYACVMAAFWSYTKALRRVYGNEMLVTEVISPPGLSSAQMLKADGANVNLSDVESVADTVAHKIYSAEKKGREFVMIPSSDRLLLVMEALAPRYYQKMYS